MNNFTLVDGNPNAEQGTNRITMRNGWSQIEKACSDTVLAINTGDYNVDAVIAISPDLIPATIIAGSLNLPLFPVVHGPLLGSQHNLHPQINNPITSGLCTIPDIPSLLLITTVLDDDENINSVVKDYQRRGHVVELVTLFYCSGIDGTRTRFYWQFIQGGQKSVKLTFPW